MILADALALLPRDSDLDVDLSPSQRAQRFGDAPKCLPWLLRVCKAHCSNAEVRSACGGGG
jgi:hypothetical protein